MKLRVGQDDALALVVSISVARTLIFLTMPDTVAGDDPVAGHEGPLGESRMRPETKFETTFWRPKPMPSDRPPATSAKLEEVDAGRGDSDQPGERQAGISPRRF